MEKYIGLAIRAGKCVFGVDNILKFKGKQFVIVEDNDLAENSRNKIELFANSKNIEVVCVKDLEKIVHKQNVKCVSITQQNLAEQIKLFR